MDLLQGKINLESKKADKLVLRDENQANSSSKDWALAQLVESQLELKS